jgi:hypothetical protein
LFLGVVVAGLGPMAHLAAKKIKIFNMTRTV